MQPDLLSPEKEEHQPEALESASLPEGTNIVSIPPQESVPAAPPVMKKSKLPAIALGVFLFLLLAAFAWVGYWAYTLSTELASTQQQLGALQAEHEKLQSDYTTLTGEKEKLNAELTQSKADLEKANTDLAAAQTSLAKTDEENTALQAKVSKASKLVEILYSSTTMNGPSDIIRIDSLVTQTKDQELIKQWNSLADSPSEDKFGTFFIYLIEAAHKSLK